MLDCRCLPVVFLLCACSCAPPEPEPVTLDGVRVDSLFVGSRDQDRRAPLRIEITNTTTEDIAGMQIAFLATDEDGEMGPFWLPQMGSESDWALKAGVKRQLSTFVVGFGTRDLSNLRPVDVRFLGADLRQTVALPESERRSIFAAIVACEDSANDQALALYPENFDLPAEEQVRRLTLRAEHAEPLRDKCLEDLRSEHGLSVGDEKLISNEGIVMRWPPIGNN